ncbi:MAG: trypsin-like peptidase domain-containing protein [Erysipelotrichaceae bacterium]|nr:trypsin-like peptidase domain-containing protein [Erysipelotrichaceae bacterium]
MDEYFDIEEKKNEEEIKEQQEEQVDVRQETYPLEREKSSGVKAGWLILAVAGSLLLSVISSVVTAGIVAKKAVSTVVVYEGKEKEETRVIQQTDYTELVEEVKNTVVEVYTEQVSYNSYFGNYVTEGAGSGVIYSADGYIITNNHVIDGASSIFVTLANGEKYNAELVATDVKSDLAVIRIEAEGLQPAVLGNSEKIAVGQICIAIGNPMGTLGGTVTAGIVSGLSRDVTIENVPMTLMQINVAISPGNSGGGLFSSNGELIGIVNAKSVSENVEGIGFAIPIDVVKEVVEQLITQGYVTGRAQLGIKCVSIDSVQKAWNYNVTSYGVLVMEAVEENAKAAGLQENDLIVAVDGTKVESLAAVQKLLYGYQAGQKVTLTVLREGQQISVDLVLSQKK